MFPIGAVEREETAVDFASVMSKHLINNCNKMSGNANEFKPMEVEETINQAVDFSKLYTEVYPSNLNPPPAEPLLKKRKHRRGKAAGGRKNFKRQQEKVDSCAEFEDCSDSDIYTSDSACVPCAQLRRMWPENDVTHTSVADEEVASPVARKRKLGGLPTFQVRPVAPMAPMNSTQFLIDDHELCNSNLYRSFETPKHDGADFSVGSPKMQSPLKQNPFLDVNYEYDSPDDIDTVAFLEKDFENEYATVTGERLADLSRENLIQEILVLEQEYNNLIRYFNKTKDSSSNREVDDVISELLQEYRCLKKRNETLREENKQMEESTKSVESVQCT